ncbi:sigma factor-like helix-turn-helix DNA-binding protein [Paenibacillus sp. FSL R7-0652]|uniref:sigma factor-like helix-turn-helix DNA-binding protein n=1 Tax=Paenibacillus sp. FSL R7-0652 TaxID=2921687 RepID=UPI00315AAA21
MESHSETVYERYKTEIYRIGWRIQYRAKKLKKKEFGLADEVFPQKNFASNVIDKVTLCQLLGTIPKKGRIILQKIYLEGYTEADVAHELGISQQAVNRWKNKMLKTLSQTANF